MPESTVDRSDIERIAYSPAEAAHALGISRAFVYTMMNDGRVRSFKIGRSTKIPAADIHAFADDAQSRAKHPTAAK